MFPHLLSIPDSARYVHRENTLKLPVLSFGILKLMGNPYLLCNVSIVITVFIWCTMSNKSVILAGARVGPGSICRAHNLEIIQIKLRT